MIIHRTIRQGIYSAMLAVLALAGIGVAWETTHLFYEFYYRETRDELLAIANRAAVLLQPILAAKDYSGADRFCKKAGAAASRRKTRFTVVLLDGTVIGDSERPPETMVNHRDRPEIREALRTGKPASRIRYSTTLSMPMMYVAVPLAARGTVLGVLRTSRPLEKIRVAARRLTSRFLVSGLIAAAVALLLSVLLTRKITQPIFDMEEGARRFAAGDFNFRLGQPKVEELASLSRILNEMAARIQQLVGTLTRERNELQSVLSSMGEGLIAVDAEHRILTVNRLAADLLEIPKPDNARGRPLLELSRNAGIARVIEKIEKGHDRCEAEIRFPTDAGDRIVLVHANPMIESETNQTNGAVLILRDITRLRRLEQARRDFVDNVSHELRTPLTALGGFIEILRDGAYETPEQARHFLDVLHRQSTRMQRIIEDLLLLARLERNSDEQRFEIRRHPLAPVLQAAAAACRSIAEQRRIDLDVRVPEDLNAPINSGLLEQAVVNLIENALNYSPPETVVTIEARRQAGLIEIMVRDQGIGIPRMHQSRIFERFYRVDKARSRDAGGTGLGLAIVKHIVLAHGGRVSVESTPGKGSTFTIILPEFPNQE